MGTIRNFVGGAGGKAIAWTFAAGLAAMGASLAGCSTEDAAAEDAAPAEKLEYVEQGLSIPASADTTADLGITRWLASWEEGYTVSGLLEDGTVRVMLRFREGVTDFWGEIRMDLEPFADQTVAANALDHLRIDTGGDGQVRKFLNRQSTALSTSSTLSPLSGCSSVACKECLRLARSAFDALKCADDPAPAPAAPKCKKPSECTDGNECRNAVMCPSPPPPQPSCKPASQCTDGNECKNVPICGSPGSHQCSSDPKSCKSPKQCTDGNECRNVLVCCEQTEQLVRDQRVQLVKTCNNDVKDANYGKNGQKGDCATIQQQKTKNETYKTKACAASPNQDSAECLAWKDQLKKDAAYLSTLKCDECANVPKSWF